MPDKELSPNAQGAIEEVPLTAEEEKELDALRDSYVNKHSSALDLSGCQLTVIIILLLIIVIIIIAAIILFL